MRRVRCIRMSLLAGVLFWMPWLNVQAQAGAHEAPDATAIELPYESEELTADYDAVRSFSFEVAERAVLSAVVNAQQLGSLIDMTLELLNGEGQSLAANDDTDGLDPRLELLVDPGRYTVVVRAIAGAGAYRLSVLATKLLVDNTLCQESTLRPVNVENWSLGKIEPGRQIQVLLEAEPGSRLVMVLQEVISDAPSLMIAVAEAMVEGAPGVLIYDVPGVAAKTYLVQILSISGSGHYRMCWAPTGN